MAGHAADGIRLMRHHHWAPAVGANFVRLALYEVWRRWAGSLLWANPGRPRPGIA